MRVIACVRCEMQILRGSVCRQVIRSDVLDSVFSDEAPNNCTKTAYIKWGNMNFRGSVYRQMIRSDVHNSVFCYEAPGDCAKLRVLKVKMQIFAGLFTAN